VAILAFTIAADHPLAAEKRIALDRLSTYPAIFSGSAPTRPARCRTFCARRPAAAYRDGNQLPRDDRHAGRHRAGWSVLPADDSTAAGALDVDCELLGAISRLPTQRTLSNPPVRFSTC
jgi:hypothetical protein